MLNQNFILVLDSGFGGLDILKDLLCCLPQKNYIYFHDGFSFPYGTKSPTYLIENLKKYIHFFIQKYPISQIILACNTATLYTLQALKKIFIDKPIYGVYPNLNWIEKKVDEKKIACIATYNTFHHPKYVKKVEELFKKKIEIINIVAGDLINQIENHFLKKENIIQLFNRYILPTFIKDPSLKTLILGCTHYNLIQHLIEKQFSIFLDYPIKIIKPNSFLIDKIKKTSKNLSIYPEKKNLFFYSSSRKNILEIKNTTKTILNFEFIDSYFIKIYIP